MQRKSMSRKYYSLYDRLLSVRKLEEAFLKVRAAKGAPGIDGQSIKAFEEDKHKNLSILFKELKDKSYKPKPVKRVEIPKPGGGIRKLGIPAVRDRIIQQVLLDVMNPIFDKEFHPSSYGYRPGRSCHQAICKAQMFVREYDMRWVVDMDLSKCFDTLDHDIIIQSVKKRITDGSILKLIRQYLVSGVVTEEGFEESRTGSPQGGVISPLLANIYLDAFDKFTMGRNYRIVRYADDILIFTRSKRAALNAREKATEFLEKTLKLKVNQEKTHVAHSFRGINFLGVAIYTQYTRIQDKKLKNFKEEVKKITRRNSQVNLVKVITDLNPKIRGFGNYFKISNSKTVYVELMSWIRRRLRAKQLKLWKKSKRLHRRLRQLGYKGEFKSIKMNSRRNANSPLVAMALPNKFLTELGLFNLSILKTGISVPIMMG